MVAVSTAIGNTAVEELKKRLRGELIRAGEPGYDAARQVWNGMIDKRPALIVRCTGVGDVIDAVNVARDNDLLLAVRGGSHSAAGLAMCDGGLVIDLSPMKGVRIDPRARTVDAQGGLLWADLDRETQAFGLATTGGTVSNTGIGGLTLGGGLGWLMGKHGFACDNLLSVDLVTADGQLVTASANEYADLFWALRGGGGNFGVATSFEFRLHPVGPVLGGMVIHPLSRARDVLRFYREFCRDLPDEAEAFAALLTSPDGNPVIALLLGFNGPLDEGERVLAPARQFGPPVADLVGPMPYVQRQRLIDDPLGVNGIHRYWKSGFATQLSDAFIDLMVEQAGTRPSPMTAIGLFYVHGVAGRVDPSATAFGLRANQWDFDIISQWTTSTEAPIHVQWTREFWAAAEPFTTGAVYVNHIAEDEPGRVHAAFGNNYDRLVAVKKQYDPGNLFRLNHNIQPE